MNIRDRAKNQLPTVLLTLISIVQALALELLWGKILESGTLHVWSLGSITDWLQVVATFTGLVLVWVLYANNIMRFRWVPNTLDSIAPFFIGLLQFSLVNWIGPSSVGKWIMTLAVIFALMATIMQHIMRMAREDGDNDPFFAGLSRATWRDFLDVIVISAVMFACGLAIQVTGYRGVGTPIFVLVCWGLLMLQLIRAHRFWMVGVNTERGRTRQSSNEAAD